MKCIHWYESLSIWPKLALTSLATAVPFYLAAFLSYWITEVANTGGWRAVVVHAVMFIIVLAVVIAVLRVAALQVDELRAIRQRETQTLLHAYTLTDRAVVDELGRAHGWTGDAGTIVEALVTSRSALQAIVGAAYTTFEANYGARQGETERTDFEITFMTKSYIDGRVTIPAAANREGRAPRSMVLRAQNPAIYEGTVTASIYRAPRPAPVIVENTAREDTQYSELYPGQKQRIKSSIIYPVLSDTNELLGTLVVHCDHAGFFSHRREKFWFDVMEVFAKRLALQKMKMDRLVACQPQAALQLPPRQPYF